MSTNNTEHQSSLIHFIAIVSWIADDASYDNIHSAQKVLPPFEKIYIFCLTKNQIE